MIKRVPAFLLALALLSALFPVRARAEDAAVLMVKHAVFTGWQLGDGKVKSLTATRTVTDKLGKTVDTGVENRIGMVYRRDASYPDGSAASNGFTGNLFWEGHENGFTTPTYGDATSYYLALDALVAEGTPQLPATNTGADTVNGKPVDIVNVTMDGAKPMNLYVDSATGAYLKLVVDPGGSYETTIDNLTYTTIGGKKFLSSFRYDDGETVTYSNYKINPQIGVDALHPPAPTATWAFTDPSPMKVRVTQNGVYFDATINGVKGRFQLDTGADGILVTKGFAGRLNAKPFRHTQSYGIGGEGAIATDLLKVDTIEVGGNVLSNVVVSANKAQFNGDDEKLDGLFGFAFLGGAVVEVNLSNQTMAIHEPQSSLDAYPGVVVNPDLSDGTPVVPMKMDGTVDVNATFDMGSSFQVLFPHDLPAKTGLKFLIDNSSAASHVTFSGVAGDENDECGNIDSMAVGPIVYSPLPACNTYSLSGRDVLVGFDFLKNFDFVFAYAQGKIVMTPHKQ